MADVFHWWLKLPELSEQQIAFLQQVWHQVDSVHLKDAPVHMNVTA